MSLFFLSIFAVYSGMHAYAYLRAKHVFGFNLSAGIAVALFMLLMILAVFLVRLLEVHEYERTARVLAYIAYLWMAALFLFFCTSLLFDFINFLGRGLGSLTRANSVFSQISLRVSFFVSLGLSLAICAYGYYEALTIRAERIKIETAKLPAGTDHLTIVQISDVHLGLIVRCDRLAAMLAVVKAAKPDILISTGDLVDAQINHLTGLADLLREIQPKFGKYAITGNHEYYAGIEKAIAFTEAGGFRVLRNEAVNAGPIVIVGVNDRTGVRLGLEQPIVESKLLASISKDRFKLFLKHQPIIDRSTIGSFDLQISGHTHKGQIFPFTLLTLLTYPQNAGAYDLGNGSRLYVSRGTGTWGPPIRFLSPPEVTIFELVRKVDMPSA